MNICTKKKKNCNFFYPFRIIVTQKHNGSSLTTPGWHAVLSTGEVLLWFGDNELRVYSLYGSTDLWSRPRLKCACSLNAKKLHCACSSLLGDPIQLELWVQWSIAKLHCFMIVSCMWVNSTGAVQDLPLLHSNSSKPPSSEEPTLPESCILVIHLYVSNFNWSLRRYSKADVWESLLSKGAPIILGSWSKWGLPPLA